jgi:hypothetical protein
VQVASRYLRGVDRSATSIQHIDGAREFRIPLRSRSHIDLDIELGMRRADPPGSRVNALQIELESAHAGDRERAQLGPEATAEP